MQAKQSLVQATVLKSVVVITAHAGMHVDEAMDLLQRQIDALSRLVHPFSPKLYSSWGNSGNTLLLRKLLPSFPG
jgi:hypothetical protein